MRRRAREIVLKALYSIEINKRDAQEVINDLIEEENLSEIDCLFARRLLYSTQKYINEADKLIEKFIENWSMDRVATIEKTVLRMAIAEMEFFPENPVQVIINEAVELAKRFVSNDAGKFVNGILDRVAKEKGLL